MATAVWAFCPKSDVGIDSVKYYVIVTRVFANLVLIQLYWQSNHTFSRDSTEVSTIANIESRMY